MDNEIKFEIKLFKSFEDFVKNLQLNKQAILNSKISFLESTGFLGNCKTLGNNVFEYTINEINKKIYCCINNNSIVFSTIIEELKNLSQIELLNWNKFNKELLSDIKYAKVFFERINTLYKQTNEENFFMKNLYNIFEIQQNNFKKITGFNADIVDANKKILNIEQLNNKIYFLIQLKSLDYISEKAKIEKEEIEKILKIKENFDLSSLEKLIKFLNK